ncbi:hypothetical protein PFISCL1PPCAC_23379, partial [Pristionchus fissidentatus]
VLLGVCVGICAWHKLTIVARKNYWHTHDDGWTCGGGHQWSAYDNLVDVRNTCGYYAARSISTCCLSHHICYKKKKGRTPCDDEFDRCLSVTAPANSACANLTRSFVTYVVNNGQISYDKKYC